MHAANAVYDTWRRILHDAERATATSGADAAALAIPTDAALAALHATSSSQHPQPQSAPRLRRSLNVLDQLLRIAVVVKADVSDPGHQLRRCASALGDCTPDDLERLTIRSVLQEVAQHRQRIDPIRVVLGEEVRHESFQGRLLRTSTTQTQTYSQSFVLLALPAFVILPVRIREMPEEFLGGLEFLLAGMALELTRGQLRNSKCAIVVQDEVRSIQQPVGRYLVSIIVEPRGVQLVVDLLLNARLLAFGCTGRDCGVVSTLFQSCIWGRQRVLALLAVGDCRRGGQRTRGRRRKRAIGRREDEDAIGCGS